MVSAGFQSLTVLWNVRHRTLRAVSPLTVLTQPTLLLMTLGVIAIASFGKFAGAFLGGEIGGRSTVPPHLADP